MGFQQSFNNLLLRIAKRRWLKIFSWALPRVAYVGFPSGEQLAIDTYDLRGPSFHMVHGWKEPEVSLGSYELIQRNAVESYLGAKSRDGDGLLFLDIGANIGLFTFSAKRSLPALSVIAFEPHPVSAICLRETALRNNFKNVSVERTALTNVCGKSRLFLDESDSGGHSLIASNLWNNRRSTVSLQVELARLDDWIAAREIHSLDFIKMDVQGAEDAVLQGALGALSRFKPALLIEVQHEKVFTEEAVIGTIRELSFRYVVRSMKDETGSYDDLREWSKREFHKGILFADYLFLPH